MPNLDLSSRSSQRTQAPAREVNKPRASHALVTATLRRILAWYFGEVYGRAEGPKILPFYCDQQRVGHFAVKPSELAAGHPPALFRLFVAMAMFQARRDVLIMRQQASMPRSHALAIVSSRELGQHARRSPCDQLVSAATFDAGCSVYKTGKTVDCARHAGEPCHVKEASRLLNRMGDMGKLPTSAWLHHWKDAQLTELLQEVRDGEAKPSRRAELLVERFCWVYRVGEKLATMFVSALSTPALAPGLTPWFPAVDGNTLVIVDTNVSRAVDLLREPGAAKTYEARATWIRKQAQTIDLRQFCTDVPGFSPRLVQQALYWFCSKSNRVALANGCCAASAPCGVCVRGLCPFAPAADPRGPEST